MIPKPSVWAGKKTPDLNSESRFLRGGQDHDAMLKEGHMIQGERGKQFKQSKPHLAANGKCKVKVHAMLLYSLLFVPCFTMQVKVPVNSVMFCYVNYFLSFIFIRGHSITPF